MWTLTLLGHCRWHEKDLRSSGTLELRVDNSITCSYALNINRHIFVREVKCKCIQTRKNSTVKVIITYLVFSYEEFHLLLIGNVL